MELGNSSALTEEVIPRILFTVRLYWNEIYLEHGNEVLKGC